MRISTLFLILFVCVGFLGYIAEKRFGVVTIFLAESGATEFMNKNFFNKEDISYPDEAPNTEVAVENTPTETQTDITPDITPPPPAPFLPPPNTTPPPTGTDGKEDLFGIKLTLPVGVFVNSKQEGEDLSGNGLKPDVIYFELGNYGKMTISKYKTIQDYGRASNSILKENAGAKEQGFVFSPVKEFKIDKQDASQYRNTNNGAVMNQVAVPSKFVIINFSSYGADPSTLKYKIEDAEKIISSMKFGY